MKPDVTETVSLVPFLKWAGGKRWFVAKYNHLLPKKFDKYIEPFLGGGAIYFHLRPAKAILGDCNADLVATYAAIRDNWEVVRSILRRHQRNHSTDYYYAERDRVRRSGTERAAQFLYLNRTCWNGLYRVNLRGRFNVPIGTKQNVLLDTDNFDYISVMLKSATLLYADFEITLSHAKKGDFAIVDPPYVVNHNMNGFLKYNEKIFSWADQLRLREAVERARRRGVKVLVLNANHKSVRDLYRDFGREYELPRHSVLAGNPSYRKPSSEIAILAY